MSSIFTCLHLDANAARTHDKSSSRKGAKLNICSSATINLWISLSSKDTTVSVRLQSLGVRNDNWLGLGPYPDGGFGVVSVVICISVSRELIE